jgi:hypothetical protein
LHDVVVGSEDQRLLSKETVVNREKLVEQRVKRETVE